MLNTSVHVTDYECVRLLIYSSLHTVYKWTSFSDDIHVYDVDDGTLLLGPLRHRGFVSEVQWSRDGSRLFSGSADTMIRCWNSDTGEQIGHPWTGHTDSICSLSTSPDGLIITSASHDHTVRFWDATTGNPIGPASTARYTSRRCSFLSLR